MDNFKTKYGFFDISNDEYVITNKRTPKPWINVISNGDYGLVISQLGGGFSWKGHSEFNRLNRWHQDLIQDNWGKFFYYKDKKTGEIWSNSYNPVQKELDNYECRHGFGYTKILSKYKDIESELTVTVPLGKSAEIWKFTLKNTGTTKRQLSVYSYFEWCLGSSSDFHREFHKAFIETDFDREANTMVGNKRLWEIPLSKRGHWNINYPYTGYITCNKTVSSFESDKETFIGNYGSPVNPVGLLKDELSNSKGRYLDPVGTLKIDIEIAPGESEDVIFLMGIASDRQEILSARNQLLLGKSVDNEVNKVRKMWKGLLDANTISTPDEAMNLSFKWVKYQAIAGRLWARTAYYQQSGAFGFRDQLQDSLVFLPIDPDLTLKQIKLHAEHQFKDGTVLHWWHPITETGLRTEMTDDLLWLPFLLIQLIEETGDDSCLNEKVKFIDTEEKFTLYYHSEASINMVFSRFSKRGLPLIGAGDWNDGLSAVGLEMKGESVWLAHFFVYILTKFSNISDKVNPDFRKKCLERKTLLIDAIDKYGWEGDRFIRATKDNMAKIGSKENSEGSIYLNSQTWAVIADSTDLVKKKIAMSSVKKYLLKDFGTLLLTPAYTVPDEMIGYLSRYAPGRRENGGVYTHAATWAIWAYALLKDQEPAYECYKRINPVLNGMKPEKYKCEPYVTPGNIDGPESPDYGMGGWTWYTGSAAWYQKMIFDWILGIRATREGLIIDPCIPRDWTSFKAVRKFRGSEYNIEVINKSREGKEVKQVFLDNVISDIRCFNLINTKCDIRIIL
ncbi:MAG: glycosyl transferase family 36 [Ignavibacteriaceae bacterium]